MRRTALVVGLLAAVACPTTPYTRRSQLILISAEQETKLGAQAYQEVLAKSRLERSSAVVQPIEAVGQRSARAVPVHPSTSRRIRATERASNSSVRGCRRRSPTSRRRRRRQTSRCPESRRRRRADAIVAEARG